jgi:hypothetical protein
LEHELKNFPHFPWDDDPIWLFFLFFRGVGQPPTRSCFILKSGSIFRLE